MSAQRTMDPPLFVRSRLRCGLSRAPRSAKHMASRIARHAGIPTPADRRHAAEWLTPAMLEIDERLPAELHDFTPALRVDLLERIWWALGCARLAERADVVASLEELQTALTLTPELVARLEKRAGKPV